MFQQFKLPNSDVETETDGRSTPGSSPLANANTRLPSSGPRVDRACDVCRRMKIKCDGENPCGHCGTSFNDCVYSQPRRKKRNVERDDRMEYLEKRLKAVEESCRRREMAATSPSIPWIMGAIDRPETSTRPVNEAPRPMNISGEHSHPENQGEARFLHSAAHMDFVRRLKDELGNWPGADVESRVRARDVPAPKLFPMENTPRHPISLPSRERARHLVDMAVNTHFLHNILHRPTFDSAFALLFSLDISDYADQESRYLPLLFAVMAVGCLCEVRDMETRERLFLEGYFSKNG